MSFVKQYIIVFNQFCMIQNQGFLITCCYSYLTILSLEKVDFPPSADLGNDVHTLSPSNLHHRCFSRQRQTLEPECMSSLDADCLVLVVSFVRHLSAILFITTSTV